MATSRSSSPDGDSAPLPSVRSKLQAMLDAASDSEGEEAAGSKVIDTTKVTDDEDEEEVRPRGRFASRMYESTQDAGGETNGSAEDARERVRRSLQLDDSSKTPENSAENSNAEDKPEEDDEEDDDLPVAPRRRRLERQSTPAGSPRAEQPMSSPGLFVKEGEQPTSERDSDSDLEADVSRLMRSERFQAQVERKKKERLARQAEEKAKKAAAAAAAAQEPRDEMAGFLDDSDADDMGITDDEGGHKLTQDARPSRKASKKAREEMNRETQRMARNMQLAHQAKTKKKVTKAALFEKFNFRLPGAPQPKQTSSSRPASPASDVEMKDVDTPPSSPPTLKPTAAPISLDMDEEEFPAIDQIPASSQSEKAKGSTTAHALAEGKGKGKAVAVDDKVQEIPKPTQAPKRRVRVKLPPAANVLTLDSDDDELTITTTKKTKLDALFDKIPQQKTERQSLVALRALAHVTSPGKGPRGRKDKAGMSAGELQAMLANRVREQTKLERERRVEMLRAKGVVVQTEEERLRQIEEVEDLVARAREEADEIMHREKEEVKKERKERKARGEGDALDWDDSSDDEDYQDEPEEEDEDKQAAADLELSGSEEGENDEADDEADEDEVEDDQEDEDLKPLALFEEEAEDGDSEAEEKGEGDKDNVIVPDDDEDDLPKPKSKRSRRVCTVLSDPEDMVEATPQPKSRFPKSPAVPSTVSPAAPRSVLRSATKNFIPGLPVAGGAPAGLGLTQMFAGTMDNSQAASPNATTQSPMPTFDPFSKPSFAPLREVDDDNDNDEDIVMDSQSGTQGVETQQSLDLHLTQTQVHGLDSLARNDPTQMSELLELSQDNGLEEYTPLRERFIDAPGSTMSTVRPGTEPTQPVSHDSPLVRKGRLRRRTEVVNADDSEPEQEARADDDEFGFGTSAFETMKEAAKKEKKRKALEEFDRKKSKAKEMVEDQAAESEDEYAGLGGADGEDSDDDDLASVKDMIDDDKRNNADERKLAALFAERDRADDEKKVEKLFKDITTGMLRRKRGADYDLDDSDDGGEARKRLKRRQFAKMQKALFSDERVKKMAENPGNQAFLRTLEDRVSDDEMDVIDVEEPNNDTEESQSQPENVVPDSQQQQPAKRPVLTATGVGNRPPPNQRRTKDGKKPSNLGEIRESLSSLLEEPYDAAVVPATEYNSDESEADGEEDSVPSSARSEKENHAPRNQRRTNEVRDRISLKRAGSSSSSSVNARHAFTLGSTQSSFKAPALLRRATSNSFMTSVSTGSGTSGSNNNNNSLFGERIKKGATKGSGVQFDRGKDRREALKGMQQRRTAKKLKGSEERLRAASGLFGGGKFE